MPFKELNSYSTDRFNHFDSSIRSAIIKDYDNEVSILDASLQQFYELALEKAKSIEKSK